MNQRLRKRERSNAKDAASEHADKRSAQTPMERFRSLARRLVNIPRDEFEEERARDVADRAASRSDRKRTPT
jgi:hypothetical protein